MATNYPIPMEGAIYSPDVVRFRQFQDRIESLDMKDWRSLPVISMPPTRWPKLTDQGRKYSFSEERELVRNKMRAALRICVFNGYNHVVIGDFGLGNGYRNPPKELAELWRDVFLYDPELRGQFLAVMFAFEDDRQCTAKCILDDIAKKTKGSSSSSSSSKSKSKSSSSSSSSLSGSSSSHKSDFRIFSEIFADNEIARVRSQPDPRYAFSAIMSGS
ncbi:mitochondrial chaperone bcs1 [Colletotrichum higginsianum]|nr:mitochondrial chaperone bcs1 [Colletotrichum higginsianum]